MKCHVFQWELSCYDVSPLNYDRFTDAFEAAVCSELKKYVEEGKIEDFYDFDDFDPARFAEATLSFPAEHYNEDSLAGMFQAIDVAADEYLGSWSFEQMPDEEVE